MSTLKVTCAEKYVLIDQQFQFDFPVQYTEFQQLDQAQFETQVHNQDIIIISDLNVNEQVLANNPSLKLLALCSTGFNHVNLTLLKQHGVQVCNIRGYAGDAVAEHAFTLMINLIKNFNQQVDGVKQGLWSTGNSSFYLAAPMGELKNKTLTIMGKGEIGLSLAQKAEAFGMKVIYSERKNAEQCRDGYVPFEQAVQQADILSLHCELNTDTQHMIDASVFKLMKDKSILINVGRGGLVHDADLIAAIESKKIAGFGADVLDQEPPAENHSLLQLQHQHDNVLITGHIAWGTDEAQQRLFDILQSNINQNMQGIEQNLV
ncbi:D-2-hydroxyacid dehydrogenase [Acinetobacter sp. WCHA55]|jgi:glycerate dehydrogenase|uniref:NAD(P)-dependent oxidoreductase n=1 Tax=Acinetobacter sp. WCHA55 TaxID=2004646 RepID=UPI000B3CFF0B|nr:NAD(P)-dependent oxidoreductase [Acinetobacter sp. WCHA55]AYA69591.1 D-2-hydroxyacid dehydrogenase [Acinetobacter sp. WCHA55]